MKKITLLMSLLFTLTGMAQNNNYSEDLSICEKILIAARNACYELNESTAMLNRLDSAGNGDNQMSSNQNVQKIQNFQLDIKDYLNKAASLDNNCKLDEIIDEKGNCKNN